MKWLANLHFNIAKRFLALAVGFFVSHYPQAQTAMINVAAARQQTWMANGK